jgi:tRNA (guanine-N7-)-methyltransferase
MPQQHNVIRSFVLRQGRVSNAQRRAYEDLLPKYGVPYTKGLLNFEIVYGREAPRYLEIGSGMGETTVSIARSHPQNDYLAIEVYTPGVGSLLKQIEEFKLTNLRIVQHDAVEVVNNMFPQKYLDGIHIFFPDPWPKLRHHKRRLIQPEFISLLSKHLKLGGYIHVATDWNNYADQILEVMSNELSLTNTARDFVQRPEYRPLTKFEKRGLRLGHKVWDLVFKKIDS